MGGQVEPGCPGLCSCLRFHKGRDPHTLAARGPGPSLDHCQRHPSALLASSLQEPARPHASPARHPSWLALWPGKKVNRCPRSQLFSDTWACSLSTRTHLHYAPAHTPPLCTRVRLAHTCTYITLRHTLEHHAARYTPMCTKHTCTRFISHSSPCLHVARRSGEPALPHAARGPLTHPPQPVPSHGVSSTVLPAPKRPRSCSAWNHEIIIFLTQGCGGVGRVT